MVYSAATKADWTDPKVRHSVNPALRETTDPAYDDRDIVVQLWIGLLSSSSLTTRFEDAIIMRQQNSSQTTHVVLFST